MGDEGSCEGTRDMEVGSASIVSFARNELGSFDAEGCGTMGVGGSGGSTFALCGGRANGEEVLCT